MPFRQFVTLMSIQSRFQWVHNALKCGKKCNSRKNIEFFFFQKYMPNFLLSTIVPIGFNFIATLLKRTTICFIFRSLSANLALHITEFCHIVSTCRPFYRKIQKHKTSLFLDFNVVFICLITIL